MDSQALAIAAVIAEIAELDGNEAALQVSTDQVACRNATKRVMALQTAAAIKYSETARGAAAKVTRAACRRLAQVRRRVGQKLLRDKPGDEGLGVDLTLPNPIPSGPNARGKAPGKRRARRGERW
jgi:hypothetical protein